MMYEVTCPFCKCEFTPERWEDGTCPNCGEEYWWEEYCTEDYSDCYDTIEWHWKKLN